MKSYSAHSTGLVDHAFQGIQQSVHHAPKPSFWKQLQRFFYNPQWSDPVVRKVNRKGDIRWVIYNPLTRQNTWVATEQEARVVLESRGYR